MLIVSDDLAKSRSDNFVVNLLQASKIQDHKLSIICDVISLLIRQLKLAVAS